MKRSVKILAGNPSMSAPMEFAAHNGHRAVAGQLDSAARHTKVQGLHDSMRPIAMQCVAPTTRAQHVEQILNTTYGQKPQPQPHALTHSDQGRLLQIDAVGLCSLLSIYQYYEESGGFLNTAEGLASSVHSTLTKNRKMQLGVQAGTWLGEASDEEPLVGGLRTGKVMGEDRPQGDGQQWYSIMLWAFALNRLAVVKKEREYNLLAAQLLVSCAPRFLQRALPPGQTEALDPIDGKDAELAPPTPERPLPYVAVSPRMSVDLCRPLPARHRATDPLVGALVCGLIASTLGKGDRAQADENILHLSLERLERRLLLLWDNITEDEEQVESLLGDPMQVGDCLWASAWGQGRQWRAKALAIGEQGIKELCFDANPVWTRPYAHRYPPGEFWMVMGAKAVDSATDTKGRKNYRLPVKVSELEEAVDHLAPRMSLWGPTGSMYFCPAAIGGVFVPNWGRMCSTAASYAHNNNRAQDDDGNAVRLEKRNFSTEAHWDREHEGTSKLEQKFREFTSSLFR